MCPVHGSVNGQTTATQAMDTDLSAQVRILRWYLAAGVGSGNRLVSIKIDFAFFQRVVRVINVGVSQAEKFAKGAFFVDPADSIVAQRCDVITTMIFFAGTISAYGNIVHHRQRLVTLSDLHTLRLRVDQKPDIFSRKAVGGYDTTHRHENT